MNDKNIIVNKPEPKPGILERSDLFAIAVGMVIGSGMVTLIGPAMAYTGYSVWLAYLTAIVMGFFMVFPYIILGGTMRVAGGPYSSGNGYFCKGKQDIINGSSDHNGSVCCFRTYTDQTADL